MERRLYLSRSYCRSHVAGALKSIYDSTGLYVAVTEIVRTMGQKIFTPIYCFKSEAELRKILNEKPREASEDSSSEVSPTQAPSTVSAPDIEDLQQAVRFDLFFKSRYFADKIEIIFRPMQHRQRIGQSSPSQLFLLKFPMTKFT